MAANVRGWLSCLGSSNAADSADEITRLVKRLDDAYDALNYVLHVISGGPSADAEEDLRVSRVALEDGIETLTLTARALRSSDPSAA